MDDSNLLKPGDQSMTDMLRGASIAGVPLLRGAPRMTDLICPGCHTRVPQAASPGQNGEPVYSTDDQGRPTPQAVVIRNVEGGVATTELYCLHCYTVFQQLESVRQLRDNVPRLVWKSEYVGRVHKPYKKASEHCGTMYDPFDQSHCPDDHWEDDT